jgi:tetratricopeptide (TPR) repeat protein
VDETRAQAYANLIQQLLSCPNGEEPQILQANLELVDVEFLQVCEVIADNLAEAGQENAAEFLRNLASQLGQFLGRNDENMDNSAPENPREYLEFLQALLQAEAESNSDVKVIYPILRQRQHLLNARFAETLQQVAENLADEDSETIASIVGLIENLSIHISDFSLGKRANNIEIAIAGYQIVLSHRQPGSEKWAQTQNNLGNAYSDKIRGNRAENIDEAIACYLQALEVYTRADFPQEWAMIQQNFANAYRERIRGDRAENLELAIASYQLALEVRTRTNFPEKWAITQNNLGIAYNNRIRGNRAENLELAITSHKLALEVHTRAKFPQDWAMAQHNLGNTYGDRIRGDKAENLELAITSFNLALQVRTHADFPQDWAMTQDSLGGRYIDRIRGDRAENLELAIKCYQLALQIQTHGDFPVSWARTQNKLGIAYRNRIQGDRGENLELAITSFTAVFEVYTRKAFPEQWARTQNNLANAYRDRIWGEKAENIEKAIECYRQALEIRTPSAFPLDCLLSGRNLGNLAFGLQNWENAIYGYENAITAVEQSREWAGTEAAKQEIQENAIDVYFQMLQTCINAKNLPKAVETVERSKARNLVELLATRDLYPKGNIPQKILDQLDYLRRNIPAIQRHLGQKTTNQLSQSNDDTEEQLRSELTALQEQLDSVLAQIKIVDHDFNLTQRVEVIPYSEIQSLAANNTAIIEWYITRDKFLAFVIAPNSLAPIVWQSSTADFNNLENWNNEYVGDYRNNNAQWQQTLADKLQRLAEILHLDELLNLIPPTCDRLVLIPHSYLHLFPLHALPSKRQKINKESSQLYTATGCLLDLFSEPAKLD